jgi:abhydrolase domain-containing protein 17
MLLSKILFPAPNPPNYSLTTHQNNLLWLPAGEASISVTPIPCMIYSPKDEALFFLIWCHGNACDIGSIDETLRTLSRVLKAHVMAFEYPSYGLCTDAGDPNEQTINNHADRVYAFVNERLQWPTDLILIYGHSIGSGAACHIASTKAIGGLILQSPYTSIKNLIREKISVLSYFFECPYWNNSEAMHHIQCPVLFMHGECDNLIPCKHSQDLYNALSHDHRKRLVILPDDDHNTISNPVILIHLRQFIREHLPLPTMPLPRIEIPPALFQSPPNREQRPLS